MNDIDEILLNFSPSDLLLLNAILAIVMFSVAIDLKATDFSRLFKSPKPVITGIFAQFLILPALTFLLVVLVAPRPSIALGLILVAACPGGNISNFITHRAGGNAALSVSLTAFATVGAIVLTPLNIAFWGNLYGPTREILRATQIDPIQIAITVTFMLILPLVLGVTLNMRNPSLTAKLRRPLQNLAMLIFVAFVVLALVANWQHFIGFAHYIALLVVAHNALALLAGFGTATLAGLSPFDRRAITIETGIQNSGLGLVLIFGFFNGMGGMAVVAALWGVWHAVSGIVLAKLMSRTEAKR